MFCNLVARFENELEAAEKCGFRNPVKASAKLLSRPEVKRRVSELKKANEFSANIESGLKRLAFGCVSDAVSLLFDEEITSEKLRTMNLFNISEIKRAKGGAIEIKFFDRLKAFEKLSELECRRDEGGSSLLIDAISKSAKALVNDNDR